MNQILETEIFSQWLEELKDQKARDKILDRIDRAEAGNFGDHKPLGDHVSEMRLTHGPGYRVYYTKIGNLVFLLLCGGTKPTQKKDIEIAKEMAAELRSGNK
ncbi:type II toxin-antitoxin system RelE/ParE family toxin [Marinobacter shengliensis]|jgi:putative addiction module killer protein|uniref:type II toxin-antitoxin system RelE/ParE family toxin n=1 Tax=Marinobacter shengliensis TaxID=1389223 RepID=UPI00110845BF|nr:type II toxin-antitoxin system RelE/ParE family toxin [Marinobacter shengliensis]